MNDLMIPDANEIPSFLFDAATAQQDFTEASAGVGVSFPARIKLSGKQFTLVNSAGEEVPYPPAQLVPGPDGNTYLPVIVLRAKEKISKAWYIKKYNPNLPKAENTPPDCFSEDGIRPDPTSLAVQSELCANCPHNAFGSGTDQDGNATAGKACADKKVLAAYVPNYGIHKFDIPAGSFTNWRGFTDQLRKHLPQVPFRNMRILVGFDLTTTKSILIFRYGGMVGEGKPADIQQRAIAKVAEYANSIDAADIIKASSAPALPAPVMAAPPQEYQGQVSTAAEVELKAKAEAEAQAAAEKEAAIAKTRAEAAAKSAATKAAKKAEKEAAEAAAKLAAQTPELLDDLDLGGTSAPPVNSPVHAGGLEPSDDQLIRDLGL